MNKILLTGASGFIGKHFLNYLINQNFLVRILVRNCQTVFPKEIEVFNGDLTDSNSLNHACKDIDTIFHLAGYAHAWSDNRSAFQQKHFEINFQGTKNLLEQATSSNVKSFIYFSSVKAVRENSTCIDETWEEEPTSPYGLAKRAAEKIVLKAKETGMHVTVLRPALVYGPNWKGNLANMLRAIDRGFFPPLPHTTNYRSMVSVDDICQAALLAAKSPKANGKIYFVTDQTNYSTQQLYILMRKSLGKRIPKWHVPFVFFKCLAVLGDIGKKMTGLKFPFNSDAMTKLFDSAQYDSNLISKELGFRPAHNLESMLPKIISAYQNEKT